MNWYKILKLSQSQIRLWLDDERDPTTPEIQGRFGAAGDEIWVKTPDEAMSYLVSGNVVFLSFDHDLGEDVATGYHLAKWIEEKAFRGTLRRFKWEVHSMNPTGSQNITRAMQSADRFWDKHDKEKPSDELV